MTANEVKNILPGLYRVFWEGEDRTSLAAIGVMQNGGRWLAPCNWSAASDTGDFWMSVERVELVCLDTCEEELIAKNALEAADKMVQSALRVKALMSQMKTKAMKDKVWKQLHAAIIPLTEDWC